MESKTAMETLYEHVKTQYGELKSFEEFVELSNEDDDTKEATKAILDAMESYSAQYIEENERLTKEANAISKAYLARIAELEAELAALRGQNQWISVEERLPEPQGGDDVWKADCSTQLEVWLDGGYDIGVYWPKINEWRIRNKHGDWKPSHWRPLSPPQTQTKERK